MILAMAVLFGAPVAEAQTPIVHPPVPSPPAPTPVPSGPRLDLTLAEAIYIGLRDNRTVKSAYIERVSQKYDLFVAQTRFVPSAVLAGGVQTGRTYGVNQTTTTLSPTASWLLPTGATVAFSWARASIQGGGTDTRSDTTNLTVTQPLLKGAGLAVNLAPIRVAELQDQIDRLALKSTVANTVTGIIQAYRTLLAAQDNLDISRDSLAREQTLLQTNQALIDAGRMAAADLIQTQADLANQQVSELAAEQQRNSAQLALLQLLAMDLRTNVVAVDPVKPDHININLDQAIQTALDNRMDYLSQRKALAQNRENLLMAKNNRLWNLSVVGSFQRSTQSGSTNLLSTPTGPEPAAPGSNGTIGLQLSIPFGDFSLTQAVVQATTNVRTAEVQLDDLRSTVEGQIRDAAQTVEMSWRQYEAARTAHDLADKTLEIEREKLKAGRASNFEVLSYETALRAAELQEVSAGIAYLNALTIFDQQLGTTLDTWRISLND